MRLMITCLVVLFALSTAVYAQPVVSYSDYKGSIAGNTSSLTLTSVAVSGQNRGLAVCVYEAGTNASASVSTVVFNGSESLTEVVSQAEDDREVSWWYLDGPTATTADVVITLTAAQGTSGVTMATAVGIRNVKQAQPTIFAEFGTCSSCTFITGNLTSTEDNTIMFGCVKHNSQTVTFTPDGGQIELSDFGEAGGTGEAMSTSYLVKTPAGSEGMKSTASASGFMAASGMAMEYLAPTPGADGARRQGIRFK